jgi:uncharacterized protein DUF6519
MKGDFSRISFDATKHFSRVLVQQGRVTVDADPNEEGAILLHNMRTLARDLIGPFGGPADNLGFGLTLDTDDANRPRLRIGAGRYYVDGILVESETDCDYADQPDYIPGADDPLSRRLIAADGGDFWVYLDVWERHISWIEDDSVREPALNGPDTCSRAKVVWQVRAIARDALLDTLSARREAIEARLSDPALGDDERKELEALRDRLAQDITRLTRTDAGPGNDCTAPLDAIVGLSDAQMTARLDPGQRIKDACTVSPDSRYRGAENQLYRVEVHRGSEAPDGPTFKWSRDNGSVATRWLGTEGNDVLVASGRGFSAGAWIELTDDSNDLTGNPGILIKLNKVDRDRLGVDPASIPKDTSIAFAQSLRHAKVRRWDQTERDDTTLDEGAVPLSESTAKDPNWLTLENGIQVKFADGGTYRNGDYWLIPARVATGTIIWPSTVDEKGAIEWQPRRPDGVEHHYAPLGFVGDGDDGLTASPCLCEITPINSCGARRDRDGSIRQLPALRPPAAGRKRKK